jgi:hypothetical protein
MLSIGLWRWYINTTITVLDIIHRPAFYLKYNNSETGFCLSLQVDPTQVSPIGRASLCLRIDRRSRYRLKTETKSRLRNVEFYMKDWTMDSAFNKARKNLRMFSSESAKSQFVLGGGGGLGDLSVQFEASGRCFTIDNAESYVSARVTIGLIRSALNTACHSPPTLLERESRSSNFVHECIPKSLRNKCIHCIDFLKARNWIEMCTSD